jgi:hypothetical protein
MGRASRRKQDVWPQAEGAPWPALGSSSWGAMWLAAFTVTGPTQAEFRGAWAKDRATVAAYRAAHPGAHVEVLAEYERRLADLAAWVDRWQGTTFLERAGGGALQSIPDARPPQDPNVDPLAAYEMEADA